jgi:restriction system protein
MPIPTYAELKMPILRLAGERTWTYRELIKRISDDFCLTESERKQKTLDGSASLIDDQVHRTRTRLKDQGLIEKSRDTYLHISGSGKTLLESDLAGISDGLPLQSAISKSPSSELKAQNGAKPEPTYGLFGGAYGRCQVGALFLALSVRERDRRRKRGSPHCRLSESDETDRLLR